MPRFIALRGPGRRTARDRRTGGPLQPQAVVAAPRTADLRPVERRPRRFSSPSGIWSGLASRLSNGDERRNRRAPGASAGGKHGDDGRLRPELTGFSPAGGDRQIADCSAVNFRHFRITSATISLRLCDFALRKTGPVGSFGEPKQPPDANRIKETICVICVICGQTRVGGSVPSLCLCASVVSRYPGGWRSV